jgi:hypothetical protein
VEGLCAEMKFCQHRRKTEQHSCEKLGKDWEEDVQRINIQTALCRQTRLLIKWHTVATDFVLGDDMLLFLCVNDSFQLNARCGLGNTATEYEWLFMVLGYYVMELH